MLPLKLADIFKFLLTPPDAREVITNEWLGAEVITVSREKLLKMQSFLLDREHPQSSWLIGIIVQTIKK